MTTTSYIPQPHSLSNLCDPSYFLNTHHQTPQTSTSTSPTTTSPTSPRTSNASPEHRFLHTRHEQIRKPRKAGYIPAVLRPTEYHAKCGIKVNTSASSTSLSQSRSAATSGTVTPSTSYPNRNGTSGMMGAAVNMGMTTPPLSAGTSFDSKHDSAIGGDETPSGGRVVFDEEYFKANVNRVVTDEWNEMVMECEVTGMPTRDHWKVSLQFSCYFFPFFVFVRIGVGDDGSWDDQAWQLDTKQN